MKMNRNVISHHRNSGIEEKKEKEKFPCSKNTKYHQETTQQQQQKKQQNTFTYTPHTTHTHKHYYIQLRILFYDFVLYLI